MTRVLHVIDQVSPQACGTTLALMAESLGRLGHVEQQPLLLGSQDLRSVAHHAGVANSNYLGVPFGRSVWGASAVKRWLKRRPLFDVIHCWSIDALSLACVLRRGVPKLLTLTIPPSQRTIHWLRILTREAAGSVTLLPISNTIRRALLSGGVPESAAAVLRPGIDMGKTVFEERAILRRQWGADSCQDIVIASVADPPWLGDSLASAAAVYLADGSSETDGYRIRLLTHPRQVNRLRAAKITRQLDRPYCIIPEPRLEHPWRILPGCDLALAQGPAAGGLSLLWAMSANMPIVGEATYAICEIVEDRHSALLAQPGVPHTLSRRIGQLLHDRQLAWKLRDTARHEAYSFFSRRHYCQSLAAVYEQVTAGEPVEVPPLPQTGGLRFAGRA